MKRLKIFALILLTAIAAFFVSMAVTATVNEFNAQIAKNGFYSQLIIVSFEDYVLATVMWILSTCCIVADMTLLVNIIQYE